MSKHKHWGATKRVLRWRRLFNHSMCARDQSVSLELTMFYAGFELNPRCTFLYEACRNHRCEWCGSGHGSPAAHSTPNCVPAHW